MQHIIDAFLGEIPKRIAIIMIDNNSYDGNYKRIHSTFSTIKSEDYSKGYTIIVADLTPSQIGDNFDLKEEGTRSIGFFFKVLSRKTINVLVYTEYDNVIEIDSNRNVNKDW